MLPDEFLRRIESQLYLDASSLREALLHPASVSIRLNPHKWDGSSLKYEKVPWESNGFYLPSRPSFTLDPLFHAGVYYPQEASGMFAGEIFRQVSASMKDIRVLDLCGAPGGKSTHLSTLLGDNGFLVANEVIRSRTAVLAENITKWGMGNVIVTQNDPAAFGSLEAFFDIVIVDAPCSGEGMFHDEVAIAEWSPGNAHLCSERQRRILRDVWPSLRPGGILVYSTCTFNPAENEENIKWLSETTGAESLSADITDFTGVTEIVYRGITGYAFHPGRIRGDGFFIAALRKTEGHSQRSIKRRRKENALSSGLSDQIKEMVKFNTENIILQDNRIIALAATKENFTYIADRLNIAKSGTRLGEIKNGSFIPAHDLAMSVKLQASFWPMFHASWEEAITFLRLEDLKMPDMPSGRVLVCHRGVPLGFVNNLGRRSNNGYPQSWRIRMEMNNSFVQVL